MKKATENGSSSGDAASHSSSKPRLPRSLASPKLKEKRKHVFVFQGGTPVNRMQTASLLADRLSLKLYRVDLRPFISRFIGETEKNLDRVFEQITDEETMLYFDEADTLFGKNNHAENGHQAHEKAWVNYLNQRLKEFPGTVVVATNSQSKTSRISPRLKPVVARISA